MPGCFVKALSEYLIDCLASEQFLSMLQTPTRENRKKMLVMSEAYLKAFADAKAEKRDASCRGLCSVGPVRRHVQCLHQPESSPPVACRLEHKGLA